MRNQKYKDIYVNFVIHKILVLVMKSIKKELKKLLNTESIDHKNLIKIFPHKVFCNVSTSRCITHSNDKIFYYVFLN